jgi:DNA-binding transcriptional LysR family regulator
VDDKRVRAFLTVVEAGSFRRAAEVLNYTQSGLTQLIKHLEQELGCQLLQRSHTGVMLTREGAHLLPLFQEADRALSQLCSEAAHLAGRERQVIAVGTYPSVAKTWLPPLIRDFREMHPGLSLSLRLGDEEVMGFLAAGKVDVALVDQVICGDFRFLPLRTDALLAVFPRNCPLEGERAVTPAQLGRYPFIMPVARDMRRHILPWAQNRLRQSVSIASADDSSLLSLVEQGLGVTILPELSLRDARHVSCRPLDPPLERTLGLALPRRTTAPVRDFVAFLRLAEDFE